MKRWFPFLVLMLACAATLSAETVQEIYARGVRASIGGDNAAARELFLQVLAADPNNKAAAASLRRIEMATASKGDLKSRTEAVIVPKVDFHEASLNAVLDYLPKLAAQQKATLNIVRLFPKSYGDEKKITLQLASVPMSSVLEYVGELGGVTVEYQKSAIVLKLRDATKAAPAAQ
jgi:hypothetical protein